MNALGNLTKDVSGLWMGTIVSFDDQKEQVFGLGWGWRYKIRKIGQDSNDDQIPDANLTYALCLLGPSDGTGGGGRSRSVRYSQGDIVVGFQFQNTPIIFGALGRTSAIKYGQSGKFAPKSGFTQTIQPGLTERQEFTGSGGGPPTPQLRPQNKKENQQREKPSDALRKIGIDPNGENKLSSLLTPPTPLKNKWLEKLENMKSFSEIARDYSKQEREEDKLLLRAIQRGELGPVPEIQIQQIINRINGVGSLIRRV